MDELEARVRIFEAIAASNHALTAEEVAKMVNVILKLFQQ